MLAGAVVWAGVNAPPPFDDVLAKWWPPIQLVVLGSTALLVQVAWRRKTKRNAGGSTDRPDAAGPVVNIVNAATAGVTVVVLAATLAYTNQANRNQFSLARQGQITSRFSAAVDQLGSGNIEVRLGGIYALERVMSDSRGDYQPTVVETLAAFVRDLAPLPCGDAAHPNGTPPLDRPRTDIQAALTVIGRRGLAHDHHKKLGDLRHTCLIGANLARARIPDANLTDTDLTCADLTSANLSSANLTGTSLGSVVSTGASLPRRTLTKVQLQAIDAPLNTNPAKGCPR